MPRILALDYGDARIGVAVSDASGMIAQIVEPPIPNRPTAAAEIVKLVKKYHVKKVLIGEPKSLSGARGRSAEKVRTFSSRLRVSLHIPIEFVDERFSTVQAHRLLTEQGVRGRRHKNLVDNMAAYTLLQSYLDRAKPFTSS